MTTEHPSPPPRAATLSEIVAILGELEPAKAEAILRTGASAAEIAEAEAWANGQTDEMATLERSLHGRVAAVYAVLATELAPSERED